MNEQETTKSEPDQFSLGFLVHDVSRLRRTVIDHALKPLGITRSQWWVLTNLGRRDGEPAMQTELAKALDIGKVALGGLLDRLEANGYILRRPAPGDRRAKLVEIAPAGIAMLAAVQDLTARMNEATLQVLSPEEIVTAQNILQRMKLRLIEMNSEAKSIAGGGPEEAG